MLMTGKTCSAVANENNFAVPAFNISDYAMVNGIFEISEETDAPLIVGDPPRRGVATSAATCSPAIIQRAHRSSVPVAIHWDHGAHLRADARRRSRAGSPR